MIFIPITESFFTWSWEFTNIRPVLSGPTPFDTRLPDVNGLIAAGAIFEPILYKATEEAPILNIFIASFSASGARPSCSTMT